MKKALIIVMVIVALISMSGFVYSICIGPSFGCKKCPTCGGKGNVIKTEEVKGVIGTKCIYHLECRKGHVWMCSD